jgi:hypothetical protein
MTTEQARALVQVNSAAVGALDKPVRKPHAENER